MKARLWQFFLDWLAPFLVAIILVCVGAIGVLNFYKILRYLGLMT